jgi:hypothetical protein
MARFCLAVLLVASWAAPATSGDGKGEWRQFRGDGCLTGRSSLKGHIREPAVTSKTFVGARETLAVVRFAGEGSQTLPLPAADERPEAQWAELAGWRVGPTFVDLDGDGRQREAAASPQHRVGKFLPGRPGMQKLVFDSLFAVGEGSKAIGKLLARRDGSWEPVWKSDPIPLLYAANPITGDFDRDGRLEVAVTPWYDLWVLDLASGRLETKARFIPAGAESGRAYGWLGAFDLDADGKREVVVLGDFENFMAVLGWKGDKLVPLWSRLIERGINLKKTILRTGAMPVGDIDGDGQSEIVISLFNGDGDGRWHTLALEGMTGRVRLDLPDQALAGLVDLDDDGAAEMACTATRGPLIPRRAGLTIFGFKGGKLATRWGEEQSAFQLQPLAELPAHVNSNASTGTTTLLTLRAGRRDRPVFLTRRVSDPAADLVELTAWQTRADGVVHRLGRAIAPHLEALAGRAGRDGDLAILTRTQVAGDQAQRLSLDSTSARVLLSRRVGLPTSAAVVGRLSHGGLPAVVVQGACDRLVVFQPGSAASPARVLARLPGHGISTGSGRLGGGASFGGVVLADLLGDARLEIVAARSAEDGHAQLVAYEPSGRPLWVHDLDDLPGAAPEWNIGGLTLWFAGNFTDPRRSDVLISIRQSTMHSDATLLLDGRNGRQLWRRSEGGNAAGNLRACGGSWMAVYDHDGDGLDDALCLYPDLVSVFRGRTGSILLGRHTNRDVFPDAWTLYAVPAVADFLRDGRWQILYGANSTIFGLLAPGGRPIWKHGPSAGWPDVLPGIGDLDGDGGLELLVPGLPRPAGAAGQEIRCYDAATGRLEWTLALPGAHLSAASSPPMTPATCDIDGDGRDEAIFAAGRTLLAVGTDGTRRAGAVRWSLEFPDLVGPAAIADTDGTGRARILVVCGDGNVYVGGDAADARAQ